MISLTIKAVREATCRLLRVLRQFVRRQLLTNAGGGRARAPLLTKPKSSTASSLSHDETLGSEEKRSSRSSRLDFEVLAVDEELERHFVLDDDDDDPPLALLLPASVAVDSDMFTGIAFLEVYTQKKEKSGGCRV